MRICTEILKITLSHSAKCGSLSSLIPFVELMFLETSALTGENVEEAFMQCARKILNKIESGTSLSLASSVGFAL
jgi:GTPase SAR1 family protein